MEEVELARNAILILASLCLCAILGACQASTTELDSTTADLAASPTPLASKTPLASATASPTAVSTRPPAPAIPSFFASVEELIPIFDYDQTASLEIDLDIDSILVSDISYASPLEGRVTGYLVSPAGNGPFAGLIFMHGAGGSRSQFLPEAVTLARMGAVSLLIDGLPSRPEPWQREGTLSELEAYRSIHIQTIMDLRGGVDLLISRPEVDAGRIGFVGHSYGAILGGVLTGVEDRIQAYVLMTGYPRFSDAMPPERRTEPYIQMMDPIDPIHYIGNAAPSALFFQFGMYDASIPPELAMEYVEAASEPKLDRWYHAGHMLDKKATCERAEWLSSQLGLDLTPIESRCAGELQ